MASESVRRRMLLVATGLVIAVAAILALGVIPGVRTDPTPGATPDRASSGLWVVIIANVLVGAALLGTTLVTRRGGCASKVLLGAAGLVALAAGLVLLTVWAAFYQSPHGIFIPVATALLFACGVGDLAAGVLAFTALVVRLRQRPYLRQLWLDIKTHRLAATLFLVFWLALWGITCVTLYPAVFLLHLPMAFLAGTLVGWWRNRDTIADSITGGMLAGLLFSVIGFGIEIIAGELLGPSPETSPSSVLEALVMAGFYAVIGMVLGMVGGLIGALLAAALRRVRGGEGPAAPPPGG